MTLFVTCVYKRLTDTQKKFVKLDTVLLYHLKRQCCGLGPRVKVMTDLKLLIQLPRKHMNVFHTLESSSS